MKQNITYIISNINKALAFEWIAYYLNKDKFNLNFILLNPADSELEQYLININISVFRICYTGKKDTIKAIYNVCKILRQQKTTIVHTHLFDANIIGLTAAWLVGISKRIHTRHHSSFHHQYYPEAVKHDKYINWISTDIIAISKVVKNVLMINEKVSENKIHLIHHGFNLDEFMNVSSSVVNVLKNKYNPNNQYPVVGVISRYMELKGIQYVIPAFKKLIKTYPNALLILANAQGEYKNIIHQMLETIPKQNFIEITFESNIFALYKLFDVFIHVPITNEIEAFGQTYVEPLASGVPSIFTLSGVANEFIENKKNAIVVPFKNSDEIHSAILEILGNSIFANDLINNGKKDVYHKFTLDKMIISLESIYAKEQNNKK